MPLSVAIFENTGRVFELQLFFLPSSLSLFLFSTPSSYSKRFIKASFRLIILSFFSLSRYNALFSFALEARARARLCFQDILILADARGIYRTRYVTTSIKNNGSLD